MEPLRIRPGQEEALPQAAAASTILGRLSLHDAQNGLYTANVPLENILTPNDVPVDQEHVRELQKSMTIQAQSPEDSGQLVNVLLAHVEGPDVLAVVDGFHRIQAIKSMGKQAAAATIRPNSTWEDVFDLRIVSAMTHKSVKFARIVDWATEAWNRSPWGDRLQAIQAFSIGFNRRMTGQQLGISAEELSEIRGWLKQKEQEWHVAPGTVYRYLNTARSANPLLVQEAREGKGRSSLSYLTPQHVAVIAQAAPGPENYPLQQLLATAAKEHRLTTPQLRTLAQATDLALDLQEARQIIRQSLQKTITPTRTRAEQRKLNTAQTREHPQTSTQEISDQLAAAKLEAQALRENLMESELEIGLLYIDNLLARAESPVAAQKELYARIVEHAHPHAAAYLLTNRPTLTPSGPLTDRPPLPQYMDMQNIKSKLLAFDPGERRIMTLALLYNLSIKLTSDILVLKEFEVGKRLHQVRAKLKEMPQSPDSSS